mgnify:CR=1 FL=1
MGQKVNPVGLRLGINRGWDSVWYAKKKDFGSFLIEDFRIREYIKKNVINSGVSKVMIERTTKKCFRVANTCLNKEWRKAWISRRYFHSIC